VRISVDPEDIDRGAVALRRSADELAGTAEVVTAVARDPVLVRSAPLSPYSYAAAQTLLIGLTSGPSGLVLLAVALRLLSDRLRRVAASYRLADGVRVAGTTVALTLLAGPLLALGSFGRRSGTPTVADLMVGAERLSAFARVGGAWPLLGESTTVRIAPRPVAWAGPVGGIGQLIGRIPAATGVSVVHVERLVTPDGVRWVVTLPGTADWSPLAGRTPFDLTGDVRLMAGRDSAGRAGVVAALRAVGVRPGEPVMLAGHSQGGMVAAALAADPRVRREFTITHVVTAGAPIGLVPVPRDVRVLSLEHTEDLVPRLDGRDNPGRAGWVTVTAGARTPIPAPRSLDVGDLAASVRGLIPGLITRPVLAHSREVYRRTGLLVDTSSDPVLAAWRHDAAPFLTATGGLAWDVEVARIRGRS
jgi:hypothetical protein